MSLAMSVELSEKIKKHFKEVKIDAYIEKIQEHLLCYVKHQKGDNSSTL